MDLKGQVIYYVGPAPAKPGYAVGPAGPTSSYRMDAYTPALLDLGLKGMIGKGARSAPVVEAIVRNRGVYFAAIGGAAALIARSIVKEELLCYEDLGTEAIRRYTVKDFPAIVAIDSLGNNVYETEIKSTENDFLRYGLFRGNCKKLNSRTALSGRGRDARRKAGAGTAKAYRRTCAWDTPKGEPMRRR